MVADISSAVREIYRAHGYSKKMGEGSSRTDRPHYFLHRRFLDEQDLLVIFNSKRCQYRCRFCALPNKSSNTLVDGEEIVEQFLYVANEMRNSLSVLERVTLSNEGSVMDGSTFSQEALFRVVEAIAELRLVRRIVLETRLEFADETSLARLEDASDRARIEVLTGFETASNYIRSKILKKRESLEEFLNGLDRLTSTVTPINAYVLFKSDPDMSDTDAVNEASNSIQFLTHACAERGLPLTIRLNPMYAADGTPWARAAVSSARYSPPRLTDVLRVARSARAEGCRIYLGLATEGLANDRGTFREREDFSNDLLKEAVRFNEGI